MPYSATIVRILIAGPSDVTDYRSIAEDCITKWNHDHGDHQEMYLMPVTWETDSHPELGDDPQAILNRQITDKCDAVIGVFGHRLGTKTPRSVSGTAEEIDRISGEGKPVLLYFSREPVPRDHDPDQLARLEQFRNEVRAHGIVFDFHSLNALRHLLTKDIAALAYRFRQATLETTVEPRGSTVEDELNESDSLVLAEIGRRVIETGRPLVSVDQLSVDGLPDEGRLDSLNVLLRHNLISRVSGHGPLRQVQLTSHGLESVLLSFVPKYDAQVEAIIQAIVDDDLKDDSDISKRLGVPSIIVNHVLDQLRDQDLLSISRFMSGTRVNSFAPELQRHLSRLRAVRGIP